MTLRMNGRERITRGQSTILKKIAANLFFCVVNAINYI